MANPAPPVMRSCRRRSSSSDDDSSSDDEHTNANVRTALPVTATAVAASAASNTNANSNALYTSARVQSPPHTRAEASVPTSGPVVTGPLTLTGALRPQSGPAPVLSVNAGEQPPSVNMTAPLTNGSLLAAYKEAHALGSNPDGVTGQLFFGTGPGLGRSVSVGLGASTGLEQQISPAVAAVPVTEFEPFQAIVIDNGSGVLRAGFAGEARPRVVVSNLVGRRVGTYGLRSRSGGRSSAIYEGGSGSGNGDENEESPVYVGKQALDRRGVLTIKYPVQNGVIKNWDDMEDIWEHVIFNELVTTPEVHNVLVTDASSQNRERMAQFFFEQCGCDCFQSALPAALVAHDHAAALVLDCGHGICSASPVHDRRVLRHQVQRTFVAGRVVTETLRRMLADRGYDLSSTAAFEDVREIKERIAFVAPDFDAALSQAPTNRQLARSFELPTEIVELDVLDVERFECAELLFEPTRLGRDSLGAHQLVAKALETCAPSLRDTLLQNVLVTGGCAQLRGFKERLEQELKLVYPSEARKGLIQVDVADPSATWLGGATMAASLAFERQWVSRADYDELGGAGALLRKPPVGY